MIGSPAKKNEDLNFIPEEILEKKKVGKNKTKAFKSSLIFLAIVSVITIFFFGYSIFLSNKLSKIQKNIGVQLANIEKYKEFGVKGFVLAQRLQVANEILNTRSQLSKLVSALNSKIPENVSVDNYSLGDNAVMQISAKSFPNYTPISEFEDNLLASSSDGKNYFEDVQIGTANLNRSDNYVNFSLKVLFIPEAIKDVVN